MLVSVLFFFVFFTVCIQTSWRLFYFLYPNCLTRFVWDKIFFRFLIQRITSGANLNADKKNLMCPKIMK